MTANSKALQLPWKQSPSTLPTPRAVLEVSNLGGFSLHCYTVVFVVSAVLVNSVSKARLCVSVARAHSTQV